MLAVIGAQSPAYSQMSRSHSWQTRTVHKILILSVAYFVVLDFFFVTNKQLKPRRCQTRWNPELACRPLMRQGAVVATNCRRGGGSWRS